MTSTATSIAKRCSDIAHSLLEGAQAGLNPEAIAATSLEQLSDVILNPRSLNQS